MSAVKLEILKIIRDELDKEIVRCSTRFRDPVDHRRDALIAIGTRPEG